jgi:hypothetical protein
MKSTPVSRSKWRIIRIIVQLQYNRFAMPKAIKKGDKLPLSIKKQANEYTDKPTAAMERCVKTGLGIPKFLMITNKKKAVIKAPILSIKNSLLGFRYKCVSRFISTGKFLFC